MKMFALVLAAAVLAGLLIGTDLSRVLFNMYFLLWVPFAFILGGALFWISRDPGKRSHNDTPTRQYEPDRDSTTHTEHND